MDEVRLEKRRATLDRLRGIQEQMHKSPTKMLLDSDRQYLAALLPWLELGVFTPSQMKGEDSRFCSAVLAACFTYCLSAKDQCYQRCKKIKI